MSRTSFGHDQNLCDSRLRSNKIKEPFVLLIFFKLAFFLYSLIVKFIGNDYLCRVDLMFYFYGCVSVGYAILCRSLLMINSRGDYSL